MTTIILADDHKIVREGLHRLLQDQDGFRVIGEAADGLEAVRLTTELKPDILVTDLRMPIMNGIEVTLKVKQSLPDIKVIILSMYRSEAYVYSALSAGASAYVLKESGIGNLDVSINKVLKGEKYLSPPLSEKVIEDYASRSGKPLLLGNTG